MFTVYAHGFTKAGPQRHYNEDGFGSWADDGLFAVCDGMGGFRGGDVATAVALAALHESFCAEKPSGGYRASAGLRGLARLGAAVRLANQRVVEKSESSSMYRGIRAAIASISIEGDAVCLAHVGDCRIYRYRAQKLEQLTRDHSLINDFRKFKPDATDEEIAAIPTGVITRILGMGAEVDVELHEERAFPGDLYLLCTDGIHGMIDDDVIAGILSVHDDLANAAQKLFAAAFDAGGTDDIAAVFVRISAE